MLSAPVAKFWTAADRVSMQSKLRSEVLEDDPNFNAGKGSVFTSAGTHEMDAAIMVGKTLSAGAVASVEHVRNPIVLARAVMEKSKHVMMVGAALRDSLRATVSNW
jgi:beta-aspartyl-peptidase (threonine type)